MKVFMIICLFFYLPSAALAANAVKLNAETVAWIYESRADIRTPKDQLASIISTDYANARDEFTRHDLMRQIEPVLEKRIAEAKTIETVQFQVGSRLEEYDFDAGGFPTGFSKETFIPLGSGNGYSVIFDNAEFLTMLPVELDDARSLSGALRRDRRASVSITGNIMGVKEDTLQYSERKIVIVHVTEMAVSLRNGTAVGRK